MEIKYPIDFKELHAKADSIHEKIKNGLCVDASTINNPGPTEYQGYCMRTKKIVFRSRVYEKATNNIGEFLAICHGLGYLNLWGMHDRYIFTDSQTAMTWIGKGMVNTTLDVSDRLRKDIEKSELFLANNNHLIDRVLKWDTREWGEIPADFGRK